MNDTMSLVLATAILAVGGLGLYMYKSSDDFAFDDYNEDDLSNDEQSIDDLSVDEQSIDDNYDEPKSKGRNKTKRNKKNGGTKKRY